MKTSIATIALAASIVILNVYCLGKDNDQKEEVAPAAKPSIVLNQDRINSNDGIFTLTRNGHVVKIQWKEDFSDSKYIEILRNTTGLPRSRTIVARLDSKKQDHEDVVPDEGAFWYWLSIVPQVGRPIHVGPSRIGPDETNIGTYAKHEDIYIFNVGRNETSARISWSVPRETLDYIAIKRNTSPTNNSNKKEVIMTREWKGGIDNAFPDPNADYWYSMEVYLKDGALINRGPIKAEFKDN